VGCCIIGAIVFGFIFGLWRRIGALFGFAVENKANNPALWRYGEVTDKTAPAVKLPLLSPRFAAALAGGVLSVVFAFMLVDHADHIRQEIICGFHQAGFSLGSGENPCAVNENHHGDGHTVSAHQH